MATPPLCVEANNNPLLGSDVSATTCLPWREPLTISQGSLSSLRLRKMTPSTVATSISLADSRSAYIVFPLCDRQIVTSHLHNSSFQASNCCLRQVKGTPCFLQL